MPFFKNDKSDDRSHRLLPLMPLRDIVVFPHTIMPLFVGRVRSIGALMEAMSHNQEIVLSAQKKAKTNDPTPADILDVGTVASILQMLKLPDGTVKVLVEGKRRARILSYIPNASFFLCDVEEFSDEEKKSTPEMKAMVRTAYSVFEEYIGLNKRIPSETRDSILKIEEAGHLADTISAHISLKIDDKQLLLEAINPKDRLEMACAYMQAEIEILQVEKNIRKRVKKQMEKTQKEYYLNEQMSAIQKELDGRDGFKSENEELEERIKDKRMSKEATLRIKKEFKRLKMTSPMSAEATVIRNYIDWTLSLPWYDMTQDELDLEGASAILEADHYGLKKPKERIIEYLAVQSLVKKLKGPILCLAGPPGVGKTSIARSIARASGRKFIRISLGGVRDEAEIRGHRRTYIGALPGRIIQSLKKAGSNNPVILLDEIDKMTTDFRGDPSAALLEVLDPEQNSTFNDHYLEIDYDLSDIMFISTANNLHNIPLPLMDRMEIIELPGYTEFEKLQIARSYLLAKQAEANGIDNTEVTFTDSAIRVIINHYTMESGVRNLDREISSVSRKIAREVVEKGKDQSFKVTAKLIPKYLGPHKFKTKQAEEEDSIGMTNGLAVTNYGGTMLKNEVGIVRGKGKLILTGQLRDVMQESAQAAMTYVRSRAANLGLDTRFSQKIDIHIHFPGDHIPKDGPSAGITMATSIVSALTQIPVRKDVAMTGEITLRGRVLPIGGLKEKLLAAHRGGIRKVILPMENRRDLRDVPRRVRKVMELVPVSHMDEVLMHALQIPDPEGFKEHLSKEVLTPQVNIREKTPPASAQH